MILVSGSLAYDYIMNFPGYFRDHLLPEKLHEISVSFCINKMERNFGGTAGNIAYNLALLGEQPTTLASVGNDFGEYARWFKSIGVAHESARKSARALARYSKNCIDLSRVQTVSTLPTAGAYIMTDQADSQITGFYPGAMNEECRMKNAEFLKKAKIAIVAPGNLDDIRSLVNMYKKYRVPYIFDPGQVITALSAQDLRKGIDGAKVFISNDYELAMVLKKTGWKKDDVLKRVEVLVTTLGEKGSVIELGVAAERPRRRVLSHATPRVYRIPPAKAKNVSDPTGAGDAYRAGFIKGLLLGLPYDKVGKLASTVAAYTVETYGTQTHTFSWRSVMRRYRENFSESL